MTCSYLVNYALGTIWLIGAITQVGMIYAGRSYDHGWVFVAIMGLASVLHFAIPSIVNPRS